MDYTRGNMKTQTEKEKILREFKEVLKQTCIEAQNNKFVTPIVWRQMIKVEELFNINNQAIFEEVEKNIKKRILSDLIIEFEQMDWKIKARKGGVAHLEKKLENI